MDKTPYQNSFRYFLMSFFSHLSSLGTENEQNKILNQNKNYKNFEINLAFSLYFTQ